ncbi:MAG: hypothetical protein EOP37_25525 [Rubrivivax sp.]|nr:MAG: hypothetical protein EOP37_25525 [Rubrivivax sp.]
MDSFTPDSALYSLRSIDSPDSSATSTPSDVAGDPDPSAWLTQWGDLARHLEASTHDRGAGRAGRVSAIGSHLLEALGGEEGAQAAHDLTDLPPDRRAGWIAALVLAGYQVTDGSREELMSHRAVQVCRAAAPLATQVNRLLRQLLGAVAFHRLREQGPHRSTMFAHLMSGALGRGDPIEPSLGAAQLQALEEQQELHELQSAIAAAEQTQQRLRRELHRAQDAWIISERGPSAPRHPARDAEAAPDYLGLGVAVRATTQQN